MKNHREIRGLVALCLAAALFFHALPGPARAEEWVAAGEGLTSGQYLLISSDVALGVWQDGWLTAADPAQAPLWNLTVEEGGVGLADSAGVSVCPGPEGLAQGPGLWQLEWQEGQAVFRGTWEAVPVILAANVYAGNRFRAYPEADVLGSPEVYRWRFALYQRAAPEVPPEEPTVPTEPAGPELPGTIYFGRFHSHSALSDGLLPVEELYAGAKAAGLDFYAVTDHSDSFDNDLQGSLGEDGTALSLAWAEGRGAAEEARLADFLGLYGFEMSWPRSQGLGHIAVLGTPGWLSRNLPAYFEDPDALETFYDALSTVPGAVGIFAHPGEDSGDFQDFAHRTAQRDEAMALIEVGDESGFCLDHYLRALDRGWHVAPSAARHRTDEPGTARTAVLAEALSEPALLEAVSRSRVYATMDENLQVYFEANGKTMGSVIPAAERVKLDITIWDPAEPGGVVEVIGPSGTLLETGEVTEAPMEILLENPTGFCFLRITQPDGDVAVTAPVWFSRATDMGIADFRSETQVPLRGQPIRLTLSLYNKEAVAFQGRTATFYVRDQVIHAVNLEDLPGGETWAYTFTYTSPDIGLTDIRAVVTGTVNGEERTYEQVLTLRIRMEDRVSRILVDGSHGGVLAYDRLAELAAEGDVSVTVTEELTWEVAKTAQLLIIPAGSRALEPEFVETVAEFVKNGGTLILCGRADSLDGAIHWSAEGNRLLKRLGLTVRLQDDSALDPIHNQGRPENLAARIYNRDATFWGGLNQEQIYYQNTGSTVSGGTWLVRCFDTGLSQDSDGDGGEGDGVLLAMEDSAFGGRVFVAGGDFLGDGTLPEPANYWDPVSTNRRVLETLLEMKPREIPLTSVSEARQRGEGQLLRLRGYVTAGTANSRTGFPEMIYIQDDTGGIAVTDFREPGIQVGTAVEIIGLRTEAAGNPALKLTQFRLAGEEPYRVDPDNSRHSDAMDYASNGGRLLQVEGTVRSLTKTADGTGLARLTLADARGDLAEILIEPYILSGATGKNDLALEIKKGDTVRARGILHLDETGAPVLRVRNCDEVVYVPPNIIPRTGDGVWISTTVMGLSGTLLLTMKKRKKPD